VAAHGFPVAPHRSTGAVAADVALWAVGPTSGQAVVSRVASTYYRPKHLANIHERPNASPVACATPIIFHPLPIPQSAQSLFRPDSFYT